MNHKFHVLLAAVALQATAACYPYWTGSALEERVAALENATSENRAQLDETRRQLGAQLDKLQTTLDTLTKSATRTTAEVAAATDDLIRQVNLLRGELAESQFRFEEFNKRFESLESQVVALGGDQALQRYEAKRGLAQIERPADKQRFFDLAKGYHDRREYDFSRQLFAEFIEKYKFDELAPRAQLLIGDSYVSEKKHREAILAYQKIRETWPTSRYVPDALYKLGVSFQALGLRNEAKQFLEEAAKFSGQEAGKLARERLKQLNGGGNKRR
jgi:TolA-binding protein